MTTIRQARDAFDTLASTQERAVAALRCELAMVRDQITAVAREAEDAVAQHLSACSDVATVFAWDAARGNHLGATSALAAITAEARQAEKDNVAALRRGEEARAAHKGALATATTARTEAINARGAAVLSRGHLAEMEVVGAMYKDFGSDGARYVPPSRLLRIFSPTYRRELRRLAAFAAETGQGYFAEAAPRYADALTRYEADNTAAKEADRIALATEHRVAEADREERRAQDEAQVTGARLTRTSAVLASPQEMMAARMGAVVREMVLNYPARVPTALGGEPEVALVASAKAEGLAKIAEKLGKSIQAAARSASTLRDNANKLSKAVRNGGGSNSIRISLDTIQRDVRRGADMAQATARAAGDSRARIDTWYPDSGFDPFSLNSMLLWAVLFNEDTAGASAGCVADAGLVANLLGADQGAVRDAAGGMGCDLGQIDAAVGAFADGVRDTMSGLGFTMPDLGSMPDVSVSVPDVSFSMPDVSISVPDISVPDCSPSSFDCSPM